MNFAADPCLSSHRCSGTITISPTRVERVRYLPLLLHSQVPGQELTKTTVLYLLITLEFFVESHFPTDLRTTGEFREAVILLLLRGSVRHAPRMATSPRLQCQFES